MSPEFEPIETLRGVLFTPLKRIPGEQGDVLHGLRASEPSFKGFGEAYFSSIKGGAVKGWKKHLRMTLNLIVPVGEIEFFAWDDREESADGGRAGWLKIGGENYGRLTVPPGVWLAFRGVGADLNLLLNVANIEHDPEEAVNRAPGSSGLPPIPESVAPAAR